jgi:acyl-CoA thioester hydrolase
MGERNAMRFDLPPLDHPVFEARIAIRYGDMDALGHVNGAVYFRYLEELRMQWLESIGVSPDPNAQGPVLINAFCTYERQIVYPATVLALLYTGKPGRSSLDTFGRIVAEGEGGQVHATGGATIVWADYKAGASAPFPDWFRALVAG